MVIEDNQNAPVIVVGEGGKIVNINPKDKEIVNATVTELPDIIPYGSHIKPGEEEMLPRVKIRSIKPEIPLLPERVDEVDKETE